MGKYTQISYEQRIKIECMLKNSFSITEIARQIGVHRSTVYRELQRNKGKRGYHALAAHTYAQERKERFGTKRKLTPVVKAFINDKLEQQWSPEQIWGYCKVHGIEMVSHETIYRYIWQDKRQGGQLYLHLRRGSKRYRKRYGKKDSRGRIPDRKSIEQRPLIVAKKERVGDWEVDTIVGKGHQGRIITMVERKTYFTVLAKVEKAKAEEIKKQIINALAPYKEKVYTLTSDNGKEFMLHQQIASKLEAEFYFTHPYAAWEKGLCENTNGLIRQYLPKSMNLNQITHKQLWMIADRLNHRPRKSLNWKTPLQVFMANFANNNVALES